MPYPENTPGPDDLLVLTPDQIAEFPVSLLAHLQREVDGSLERAKAMKTRLDGALVLRYADRAAAARAAEGKDTGTVRLDDGGYTVVADLPKRVDWDQAELARMAERIRAAEDDPAEYLEISYRVPERKYTAWPDAIRAVFEPARTVRTGALKVEILAEGDAR